MPIRNKSANQSGLNRKTLHIWITFNQKTYPSFPKGAHGIVNPEVQPGHKSKLARLFESFDCFRRSLPQIRSKTPQSHRSWRAGSPPPGCPRTRAGRRVRCCAPGAPFAELRSASDRAIGTPAPQPTSGPSQGSTLRRDQPSQGSLYPVPDQPFRSAPLITVRAAPGSLAGVQHASRGGRIRSGTPALFVSGRRPVAPVRLITAAARGAGGLGAGIEARDAPEVRESVPGWSRQRSELTALTRMEAMGIEPTTS